MWTEILFYKESSNVFDATCDIMLHTGSLFKVIVIA